MYERGLTPMEIITLHAGTLDEIEEMLQGIIDELEPEPKGVVNVDMDGVLYDFTDAMRLEFAMRGFEGAENWPDPKTWNFNETWPVTEAQVMETMHAGILDGDIFRYGRPIENAVEGVIALKHLGYTVRIVTQKTFTDEEVTLRARLSTMRWLADAGVPYDEIVFCGPDKTDFFADIVIDDKPTLDGWVQRPALNLLFHQEWNATHEWAGVELNRPPLFRRVHGWKGVIDNVILWEDLA